MITALSKLCINSKKDINVEEIQDKVENILMEFKQYDVAKKYIKYGASPRAGQALITAAKVRALINGNYNVSYEDIDALACPVLRHRIKVNYTAINERLSTDDVIGLLIKETKKACK